jgi:hypothetical protein
MRYSIPVILVLLSGCFSGPKTKPVEPVDTVEKTSYVNFIEAEAATAASALIVSRTAPEPNRSMLIDLTIERLSGIMEPENREVEFWRSNFSQKDFLEIQRKEALRVRERSENAWKQVELANEENAELKRQLENERKNFASMIVSVVGGLGVVAGFIMLLLGMSKLNAGAAIMSGMIVIGSVWIYENPWFMWIAVLSFATASFEFFRRLRKSS